jgi:hypothetical protein
MRPSARRPLLALALVVSACAKPPPSERAFYYWKTRFHLSSGERELLANEKVQRLYVRFFDLVADPVRGSPKPVAVCQFDETPPLEVVPVIYLENSALAEAPDSVELAAKNWELLAETAATAGISFRELQVDCDWSDSTRDAFFAFCRKLRELGQDRRLTATIRLHQIKYPEETGIPPVDRGMLMFYNVGRLTADSSAPSSIFNSEDAARYAPWIDRYPLPLDAVLPVFSWAVHVRGGRVVGLWEKPDLATLADAPALESTANGFRARQSTFLGGHYLQQGDGLRPELTTPAEARRATRLLAQHFHPRAGARIALFDLDERNLRDYAPADLDFLFALGR